MTSSKEKGIPSEFAKLRTLITIQLKDKLELNKGQGFKHKLFKCIFAIIKFVVITAAIFIGFTLLSTLRLIDLNQGITDNFLGILFTLMILLSVLTCTIGLVKSLYYAKDNQLLLTMPVNRVNVFFSKLIVYYIYEFIRNLTYILPILIAFGMVNGYSVLYYIWSLISLFWITGITISIAALLSIPAMFITSFLRNVKWLQYLLIFAVIVIGVYGVVALIGLIPTNFNIIESWGTTYWKIQAFMNSFSKTFIPFYWLMRSVVGSRVGLSHRLFDGTQFLCLAGVIATIVVLITLSYVIVRPLFFHFASSPFEYKKSFVKNKKKNYNQPGFMSSLKKELVLYLRSGDKFFALIGIAIGMPIAILLLNKIFAAMDTRLTGTYMTITFNILIIMLFTLSSSTPLSHIYSEEGNSSYLIKTNPQPYLNSLIVKLLPSAVVMTLSLLASVIIYGQFASDLVNLPLLFISIEFFYLGHLLWSAELDFMNPQYAQYASTGTHTNNPNEVKSTIFMFLISALIAFVTYFIIKEDAGVFWWKLALIAVVFVAFRIYLYVMKIKVYYKEK